MTRRLRIGASNVTGLGAVQLAGSLLPAIAAIEGIDLTEVVVPTQGELRHWLPATAHTRVTPYPRRLPHALSRIVECLRPDRGDHRVPLLTLGDVPLRTHGRQTVFVQTPHLGRDGSQALRFRALRALFRLNLRFADAVIVQTGAMRDAVCATYPIEPSRIHVIAQPPPKWLTAARLKRTGRVAQAGAALTLFYPSAGYPHKNHRLLAKAVPSWRTLVGRLVLTLDTGANPAPHLPFVECVGRLAPADVVATYATADSLLFLSRNESYGFPLVEAMFVGIPIIAPDLPYARALCDDGALYFAPDDVGSLEQAIAELARRLAVGWWPDWSKQCARIPSDWADVAAAMVAVTLP